ncbi:MAG: Fur family transcriptional regulator [Nocardioidaceae bacterium]
MTDAALHDWPERLTAAGLRVTRPRLAVLAAVADQPHSDADRLLGLVRDALGNVSTQTVYDVLNSLTDVGLLRRIEPAGSAMRYETRVADNHHHLLCRRCGQVVDVPCAVGEAPCVVPDETHGFSVDEAEVIYWGLCPDCQTLPATERR